jgi:hypothetical protein
MTLSERIEHLENLVDEIVKDKPEGWQQFIIDCREELLLLHREYNSQVI